MKKKIELKALEVKSFTTQDAKHLKGGSFYCKTATNCFNASWCVCD